MRTPQPVPKAAKPGSSAAQDDDKGKKRLASTAFFEEESVLDPKVMVPYVTKVGEVPRKVQVERKKRLYALQDVGILLAAEGLEELDLGSESGRLPLHWFDSTDFESRLPQNWVDKVSTVIAQAAYVNYEGRCVWKHCLVKDFMEEQDSYLVQWDDTGQTSWLPRMLVHFKAENPFLFTKRVVAAVKLREEVEALIKYNLFVNNMPVDGIPHLRDDQETRVRTLAFNSKDLRERNLDATSRIEEINLDYARAMNKIVFNESLEQKPTSCKEFILPLDMEFPKNVPPPVPQFGCIRVPEYNFEERSSEFHFCSCLTKPEVIVATVKVRAECRKVLNMSLLNTQYNKSLRLDEFDQMQSQMIEQTSAHLRDSWTTLLKNIVRSAFKDVGKGWFNIREHSMDAYQCSKMKRFLHMVQYMMEDSIRFLVEGALATYCKFVERFCGNLLVEILNPDTVSTIWPSDDYGVIKKPPLFTLELLTVEGGKFDYNISLKRIEDVICRSFDAAVLSLQAIPTVEPAIMEKLFWSKIPSISAVHLQEPKVQQLRARVEVLRRLLCARQPEWQGLTWRRTTFTSPCFS